MHYCSLAWAASCGTEAHAEDQIADIRQGTNLAVTLSPDRNTIVVDLAWSAVEAARRRRSSGAADAEPARLRAIRGYSPNGGEIVYQRRIGDQWDLWLLDLSSGATRALTTMPSNEREPDFAADGRKVVFAADTHGTLLLVANRQLRTAC